jgi:hypothetical protein
MAMFETLGKVMRSQSDTLKVECLNCGRRKTFTQAEAFKSFGPGAAPYDVRGKVRCTACGRSGFAKVWV